MSEMNTAVSVGSKLPDIGTSIFAVMTRLANEHGAINLSQGFPDFDCDPALVEAVARAMRDGHNQYAPMPGVLALRQAIAMKVERCYGASFDPETEIQITCGATAGLFATLTAFVQPGDEVVLFEPCYDSYVPVIRLCGGTPTFASLRYPDYRVDWDEARRVITPRTLTSCSLSIRPIAARTDGARASPRPLVGLTARNMSSIGSCAIGT